MELTIKHKVAISLLFVVGIGSLYYRAQPYQAVLIRDEAMTPTYPSGALAWYEVIDKESPLTPGKVYIINDRGQVRLRLLRAIGPKTIRYYKVVTSSSSLNKDGYYDTSTIRNFKLLPGTPSQVIALAPGEYLFVKLNKTSNLNQSQELDDFMLAEDPIPRSKVIGIALKQPMVSREMK